MKKLKELIARLKALQTEASNLRKAKADAGKEIAQAVAHGDYEDERSMRKLSDAQLRQTLIPAREAKLEAEIKAVAGELAKALSAARSNWDSFVLGKKQAVFDEFLKAIEPFMGGPEKAELTRREWEGQHLPARDALNRCFSLDHWTPTPTAETRLQFSESFIAHTERVSAQMGWDLEKIDTAPRRSFASTWKHRLDEEGTVKVKAKSATQIDGKPFKKGEEYEITLKEFRAVSRHFEKISAWALVGLALSLTTLG